jgi:DinB superfamily
MTLRLLIVLSTGKNFCGEVSRGNGNRYMLDSPGGLPVKRMLAAVVFFTCATLAVAQGPAKDPIANSLRTILPRSQNNTVGAVEAMPADKFSYKPTPDQMTFGHLVVHIIEFNNSICSKAADVPAPKVEEVKETDSKDKLVAAVKASYAFCSEALGKMDDSKLGDNIELFGGRQAPRGMAALITASGWADHYATAAMYLRLNGIVPPSAQQKH